MIKRIALGLLVGGVVTSVPWLVNKLENEALWPVNFLDAPGAIVAIFLSGNVHNIIGGLPLVCAANVLCYALVIFFLVAPKKEA